MLLTPTANWILSLSCTIEIVIDGTTTKTFSHFFTSSTTHTSSGAPTTGPHPHVVRRAVREGLRQPMTGLELRLHVQEGARAARRPDAAGRGGHHARQRQAQAADGRRGRRREHVLIGARLGAGRPRRRARVRPGSVGSVKSRELESEFTRRRPATGASWVFCQAVDRRS